MRKLPPLRDLLASPTIRSAVVLGIAGVGFALGNVLMARAMEPADYAMVALLLTFSQLSAGLGPLGAETIVKRVRPLIDRSLWIRVSRSILPIALLMSLVASWGYDFPWQLLPLMLLMCVFIAFNNVAYALFQNRQMFGPALWLSQSHNGLIGVLGMVAVFLQPLSVAVVSALLASGYVVTVFFSWVTLPKMPAVEDARPSDQLPWAEGYPLVAMSMSLIVMIQFERLMIPPLIGLEALAVFAVLAAFAGSPFRVLQMTVTFTMLPRLRAAKDASEVRAILRSEGLFLATLLLASWVCVAAIFPLVRDWLLDGKYAITWLLLCVYLFAGTAKVASSYVAEIVAALGSARDLHELNLYSWLSLLGGVGVAIAWSGLIGVIVGAAAGWSIRSLLSIRVARRLIV